jgi:hypothetical protein
MIEPAEAVLANSSRITGASSALASWPSRRLPISWFIAQVGLVQPEAAHLRGQAERCAGADSMCAAAIGHHFLEHLAAFLRKVLSRSSGSVSSQRFRKPALLRMLLLNWWPAWCPAPPSARPIGPCRRASTMSAVQTSPKMKWQSRSRHSRWAEVISGLTTSTRVALPQRTALTPVRGEGGRRTGHVHVEAVAAGAQCACWISHGHRRVGALHVGGGADHRRCRCSFRPAAASACLAPRRRHLGHQDSVLVGPRAQVRAHARGVEHAGLVDHVALLDARGLLDEFDAGVHRRYSPAAMRCRVLAVEGSA